MAIAFAITRKRMHLLWRSIILTAAGKRQLWRNLYWQQRQLNKRRRGGNISPMALWRHAQRRIARLWRGVAAA